MKPICYFSSAVVLGIAAKALWWVIENYSSCLCLRAAIIFIGTALFATLCIAIAAGSSAQTLSKDFPLQFRLAAQFRTPLLMFIVVPLSFIRNLHLSIIAKYRDIMRDKPSSSHEERVAAIVKQIKDWNAAGRKTKLRTARPNWQSMSTKLSSNKGESGKISMGDMTHILRVDEEAMELTAEPSVTMGQISHHLVPKGLALQIQVEMESITIGGVSMGFGMETNSHRIGFFQESVLAYEIITSTGDVIKVTKESDPKLFYALPWSCGTIGFLASVTVRIMKIKPYMYVEYLPVYSREELGKKMKELAESPNAPEFLEATIYSKEKAVIQQAWYSDVYKPTSARHRKDAKLNSINLWYKPFYYKWVETFLEKGEGAEFIPIMDYFHRFTRSIFWELEDMIPFSNHFLYRVLWGWMGAPEVSLLKLFQGPVIRKASVYAHVVQESIMPISYLSEGIERFDEWYGVYPLLVFPLRVYDRGDNSGFLHPRKENLVKGKDWGIWVDLGAYGAPRLVKEGKNWDAKKNIREMEHWTRDIGGWQAYYTDLFCTRKEFRQVSFASLLCAYAHNAYY